MKKVSDRKTPPIRTFRPAESRTTRRSRILSSDCGTVPGLGIFYCNRLFREEVVTVEDRRGSLWPPSVEKHPRTRVSLVSSVENHPRTRVFWPTVDFWPRFRPRQASRRSLKYAQGIGRWDHLLDSSRRVREADGRADVCDPRTTRTGSSSRRIGDGRRRLQAARFKTRFTESKLGVCEGMPRSKRSGVRPIDGGPLARATLKRPADRGSFTRTRVKRPADRGSFTRTRVKRPADRGSFTRTRVKRPADRGSFTRTRVKRPADRGSFPQAVVKRPADRGTFPPAESLNKLSFSSWTVPAL